MFGLLGFRFQGFRVSMFGLLGFRVSGFRVSMFGLLGFRVLGYWGPSNYHKNRGPHGLSSVSYCLLRPFQP